MGRAVSFLFTEMLDALFPLHLVEVVVESNTMDGCVDAVVESSGWPVDSYGERNGQVTAGMLRREVNSTVWFNCRKVDDHSYEGRYIGGAKRAFRFFTPATIEIRT